VRIADGFWKVEQDGSLRSSKFEMTDTAEFISKALISWEQVKQALEMFRLSMVGSRT
jgi:hypothetical protein